MMPKKILLADDSVTIQKVVELTFSEGDYQVTSVSNGKQAIEELQKNRPDIVLLDIIMPEMSGYDVAEFIKKNPAYSAIPVILLTGTFEPFDEERAQKTGAEAYVTKPFDSKMLVEKVESLLAQKIKVEPVQAVPPAVVFQSRQEYEIPGIVSDDYLEKMKEAPVEPQPLEEFPEIKEFTEEESKVQEEPKEELKFEEIPSPFEGELPQLGEEGLSEIVEPPMVPQEEMFTSPVYEEERMESLEGVEIKKEEEYLEVRREGEEIKEGMELGEGLGFEEEKKETEPVEKVETPSFESYVEIPTSFEAPKEEEFVSGFKDKGYFPKEEEVVEVQGEEEKIEEVIEQQEVGLKGEESYQEAPPFVETPTFLEEMPPLVTDLSEQVVMVKEEQEKIEKEKTEQFKEEEKIEEFKEEEVSEGREENIADQFESIESFKEEEIKETISSFEEMRGSEIVEESGEITKPLEVKEEEVLEKEEPVQRKEEFVPTISKEELEVIVKKVVEEMAPSIIREISWEVIPEIAATIIKKRIEELEREVEK